MGLDMYLNKHVYIGANYADVNEVKGTINITKRGETIPINFNKVKYIVEEGAYWRKANAVHKWFVDNVQGGEDNCKEYYVEVEQLQELVDLCKQIMHAYTHDEQKGIALAQELLPTCSGFFYGGTEYGFNYFQDIQSTIIQLEPLIENTEKYTDYYYKSSW